MTEQERLTDELGEHVRRLDEEIAVMRIRLQEVEASLAETRRAEASLRENADRYRLLADSMEDVVGLSDTHGRRLYTSPSYFRLTGWTPEEILATDWRMRIHPDDLPRIEAAHRANLRGEATWAEYRCRRKDGSFLWLEVRATPILNQSGDVEKILWCSRDVTERKRAEGRMRLLEAVVENSGEAVLITAAGPLEPPGPRIVYVNPAFTRMTGHSAADAIGNTPQMLRGPETDHNALERIRSSLENGEAVRTELVQYRKDGTPYWADLWIFPLLDEHGQRTHWVGIQRDITERKRAEEEQARMQLRVLQAQKMESLGALAGGIAHDFNNLLTAILGAADLTRTELPPGSPAHRYLSDLEQASRRAAELTQQMLAYAGRTRFVGRPVYLNDLLREMMPFLETAVVKKATLKLEPTAELPPTPADSGQLRQVIVNLVTNASDALGERGGTVILRTSLVRLDEPGRYSPHAAPDLPPGSYVSLEVVDNGCGMTQETLQRIFDPFYSTKFTGRGLGLAAVLGIVRSHRGLIRATSEPGCGSTFQVLLPAAPPTPSTPSPPAEPTDAWKGRGTVLVIEDEDSVRALVQRLLERQGFTVLTARDGEEGVDLFRHHLAEITLVLTDLTMPRRSGVEALTEIRRLRHDVPALLMSGYNEDLLALSLSELNLAGFVQKPFTANDLLGALRRAVERDG